MYSTKQYFINLISAFLNEEQAEYFGEADYTELYRLSNIHNVCGIIAKQLMGFSAKEKNQIPNLSAFRQQLGYTVMSYDKKKMLETMLRNDFNNNGFEFIFVKGTAIRPLYPIPELRTSGDIDLFFKKNDFNKIYNFYNEKGYNFTKNPNEIVICSDSEHIELHNETDYDNIYFKDIFSISSSCGEYEHYLNTEQHLLYVLTHIAKHFNHCGAGIRMFMDVDVLIRSIHDFDYTSFLTECKKAGIETFTKAVFTICNLWFNTPVKAEFDFTQELFKTFENVIIDGGSFGFEKRQLGEYYINKSISINNKNNISAKLKAIMLLLFPAAEYLKNNYEYAKKHPSLLILAWLNRLFDGIFKRGKNSTNTVKQILGSGIESELYKKLMSELEI